MKFQRGKPVKRVIYDFCRTDFPALHRALSDACLDISLSEDINVCWRQWKDKFLSIIQSFVPSKIVKDTNSPVWIDDQVR